MTTENKKNEHTEAPLSVNFRMIHTGETFQFTLRDSDEESFMTRLNDLIVRLGQEGWQFVGEANAAPPQAYAQPVAGGQGKAVVPAGAAGASPEPKLTDFEGYVVGSYNGRKGPEPVVYLYEPRLQFASQRIYPERADLLPFAYPTAIECSGPAPDKDKAKSQGWYHSFPFKLTLVPDRNDDGSFKVTAKGHQKYRVPRVGELSPQQSNGGIATSKTAKNAGVISLTPEPGTVYPENSLNWVMMDNQAAVERLGVPPQLDEWLMELRTGIGMLADVSPDDPKTQANQGQWDALQKWANAQAGVVAGGVTVMVPDIGSVPLAGVVIGIVMDRFVESAKDVPQDVIVALLQRIMKLRGPGMENPNYNQDFDDNLGEVLRSVLEKWEQGTEMIF